MSGEGARRWGRETAAEGVVGSSAGVSWIQLKIEVYGLLLIVPDGGLGPGERGFWILESTPQDVLLSLCHVKLIFGDRATPIELTSGASSLRWAENGAA